MRSKSNRKEVTIMQEVIKEYLEQAKVGRKQVYKNMAVFPLLSDYSLSLEYILLDEALGSGAPLEARFVALADKLNNIRAIASDYKEKGEGLWKRFKRGKEDQKWYYEGLVKALRNASSNEPYRAMHSQFRRQVKKVFGT